MFKPNVRLSGKQPLRHEPLHALNTRVREGASQHRTAERKHEALDEKLPHEQPASCAERRADRHFLFARGGAREQHVRDVGARDEQQHPHRRKQRIQRRPELPHEAVDPAHDMHGELWWIVVWIEFGDPARDEIHLRGCPLERDPALQLGLEDDETALLRRIGTIDLHRLPQVRALLREARRHHADTRRRHAVQHERASNHPWIHAVLRDPHLVRHHEHLRRARLDVGVDDAATKLRRYA